MTTSEIEDLAIKVIRGISMDAPHAARSGHQGTAMALAPLAHVLWTRILNYDASDPYGPIEIDLFSLLVMLRSFFTQCCTSLDMA